MAAVITGVNISELNRLPQEIKADIIAEFQENNGNISTKQLAERICEIADIEPPEIIKPTEPEIKPLDSKEKENTSRELENMREAAKDEPLFSRSKVMSDEFKPTSEKSQEDIDKSKDKKHNISI